MTGPDKDRFYLDHINQCIGNVLNDVAGDVKVINRDRTIRDAVLRNLQIMAESTQRLSDMIKATEAMIPWPQIGGFRHRLVHDHFNVDEALIVRVIEDHLPDLAAAISRMRSKT